MTLSIIERQERDVHSALVNALRCPRDLDAVQRALVAEHLRAAIYVGSTAIGGQRAIQPVHTTRLLAHLRRNLGALWTTPTLGGLSAHKEDDLLGYRAILESMSALGDIVNVEGGFWIAAPLRLVEVSQSDDVLLLGGVPREVVRSTIGVDPISAGTGRFVRRDDVSTTIKKEISFQSLDIWLGTTESLSGWTRRTMSDYSLKLSRSEEIAADQLEIYAPDVFRDRRKMGRWMRATEVNQPILGPRLCRPLLSHSRDYSRPNYLGLFEFKADTLTLQRSVSVDFEISHRLRFGLDEMLGTPRTVTLAMEKDTCLLDLRYALPAPEIRVLGLGWTPRLSGAMNEGQLRFPRAAAPILTQVFRRLCLTLSIAQGSVLT